MEINIGDTIVYAGREYTITALTHTQDTEGFILRFEAPDSLRAHIQLGHQRLKRETLESQAKIIPKMEKLADQALDDKWKPDETT